MLKRILIGIGFLTLVTTIVIGIVAYSELEKSVEVQEKVKLFRSYTLPPRPKIDGTWKRYRCPEDKIAGFDFSENAKLVEAQYLMDTYGAGCADRTDDTHNRKTRYYAPKFKTYIELDVENNCGKSGCLVNVKLTSEAIASQNCVPKIDFGPLQTGKGLQVGDSEDKVRKLYGTPYEEEPTEKPGQSHMFYSDLAVSPDKNVPPEGTLPGHALRVVLQNRKVVSIEFFTGE